MKRQNSYSAIIAKVFEIRRQASEESVSFSREDIADAAEFLDLPIPKNLGDVLYSFRYRTELPIQLIEAAPKGKHWIIRSIGKGAYMFVAVEYVDFTPNSQILVRKIPDSTPEIVLHYAATDEQALLGIVRYSRLLDIFTGVTCYSLQSHLRTSIPGVGQIETDEVYVGLDGNGKHYVLPVQAKGGKDRLGVVQIEQDFAMCRVKYPNLICRAIGAQFLEERTVAMMEFVLGEDGIRISNERHYKLTTGEDISAEEILSY